MRVYVAGRFGDAQRLSDLALRLETEYGCIITHNWMTYETVALASDRSARSAECAEKDFNGVMSADLVFMVMDDLKYAYRGTFTELGMALAANKQVIMVTNKDCACEQNVFWHMPSIIKRASIDEGIQVLLELQGDKKRQHEKHEEHDQQPQQPQQPQCPETEQQIKSKELIVVGVGGLTGCGKDTAADMLAREGFQRASFASALKDIVARLFSWDRDLLEGRTPESRIWREQVDETWAQKLNRPGLTPRLMLQQWGTEVVRNNFHLDFWLILLEKEIRSNKYGQRVVITDCRFPNEIDMIKRLNGIVVRVQRGTTPEWLNDVQAWHAQGRQTPKPVVFDSSDGSKQLPHESEWCSVGLEDAVLENNSTLEDLHANIRKIIKEKYS